MLGGAEGGGPSPGVWGLPLSLRSLCREAGQALGAGGGQASRTRFHFHKLCRMAPGDSTCYTEDLTLQNLPTSTPGSCVCNLDPPPWGMG